MSIQGWSSNKKVLVKSFCSNGYVGEYSCKAKDLAFLCQMMEDECGKGILKDYSVIVAGENKNKDYFNFTDKYPHWIS